MRIQTIKISGFGLYSDFILSGLSTGLNIIQGSNEAGKSTCLEFIRTCLFGAPIGRGSRSQVRHPFPNGAKPGGSLQLALENGEQWELFWRPKTGAGVQTLFNLEAGVPVPLDISKYQSLAGEINRQLYSSVYGFSLDQLQEISSLKDDARVTDLLYGVGFGLGNISLPQVLRHLREKQMGEIWLNKGEKPELNRIIAELIELEQKINEKQMNWPRYHSIQIECGHIEEELERRESEYNAAREGQTLLNELLRLKDGLPKLVDLEARLGASRLHAINDSAASFFNEHSLESLQYQWEEKENLQKKLITLGNEQAELASKFSNTRINSGVIALKPEITALQGEKGRYQALLAQIDETSNQIKAALSHPGLSELPQLKFLSEQGLPRPELEEFAKLQTNAWQNFSSLFAAWGLLKSDMQPINEESVPSPGFFSHINPAMPLLAMGCCCGLTIGLYSNYLRDTPWNWPAWVGLSAIWLALAVLLFLSAKARKRKTTWNRLKDLHAAQSRQRKELLSKTSPWITELTPLLSAPYNSNETFSSNDAKLENILNSISQETLDKAEKSIHMLNDLPGLIVKQQDLKERMSAMDNASHNLLLNCGFMPPSTPLHTPPPHAENDEHCTKIRRDELNPFGFLPNLAKLSALLENALTAQINDENLKGRLEALSLQQQELQQAFTRAEQAHTAHLFAAGAANMGELKTMYLAWKEQNTLNKELDSLKQSTAQAAADILAVAGKLPDLLPQEAHSSEKLIAWLHSKPMDELQAARHKFAENALELMNKHKELSSQAGALKQEAKMLLSETELAELSLERESKLEQARRLAKKWSVAAVSLHFIEKAKRAYEAEHQTAVMRKASAVFREITGGIYSGLDPAGNENSFTVLTRDGEARLPEALSRGTREQLYLALRLAVIENRSRNTEPFPIILDDALVNFDPLRLVRAMNAILALATNHQILYFTCQPHIAPEFIEKAEKLGFTGKLFHLDATFLPPVQSVNV